MSKIAIGSDHGGYELKKYLKELLSEKDLSVIDVGAGSGDPCDYPNFGFKAAKLVSGKEADLGVLICKSGIGMSVVANKMPGVRAALCNSKEDAVSSREHNHANVLVLGSQKVNTEKAREILLNWLESKPQGGRHVRRVELIEEMERELYR